MSWLRRAWPFVWTWAGVGLIALSIYLFVSYETGIWPWGDHRPLRIRYHFSHVSRTDLNPFINAPGRLESSKRTVVRCQLENMTGGGSGGGAAGASTILTLLPEGTVVKKGDVLATLDASTYEEMCNQQKITVEQAKASHLEAQLNHEIALLAVHEYRDGTVEQTLKGMEGSIALARSDLSRTHDHLAWTKRMNEKGYSSVAQIVSEQHSVSQLDFSLKRQIASLELFQRFSLPKTEKTLEGQVKAAETNLKNEDLRLQKQLDRLELLQKQVDRCTIRAPHDGVLYYIKSTGQRRQTSLIAEGMPVRQRQELFYLPDMSEMEVQVVLNESIVDRVRPGLRAAVRFEALPKLVMEGRVVSVGQIPIRQRVESDNQRGEETDVRFFVSIVKLDGVSPELRPGMSTQVDIALSGRDNVLAIPHQAVRSDRGKKVCYVAHDESLELRELRIGQETTDLVEVLNGLQEGELVALNPPQPLTHVEPLFNFDQIDAAPPPESDTVVATQH